MPWVLIFHLFVVVQTPNGERLVDFGPYPSRAWCEADRSKLLTEFRANQGLFAPGIPVTRTGCVSPGAKIA